MSDTITIDENSHPADRMLARIQRDKRQIMQVMDRREKYARVLSLSYNDEDDDEITQHQAQDGKDFRRHSENYSYRFMRYLMSQVAGEPLHIRTDRDAGPDQGEQGSPGDNTVGTWVDEVYRRTAFEADLERELKMLVGACTAYGCGALSSGYLDGAARREAIVEASKDHDQVIEDVLRRGDLKAKRGQNHEKIQYHLRALVSDSEDLTPEQKMALVKRAQSHDVMAELEAKIAKMGKNDDIDHRSRDWRLADQNVWSRFRFVGPEVVFDMTVTDIRDTMYRAELVRVPLDQFKKSDLYTKSAKSKAEGKGRLFRSMLDDKEQTPSPTTNQLMESDEGKVVETWVIWIRRPDMRSGGIRRIVSPELPGMWIQASEEYPYVVDDVQEFQHKSGDTIEIDGPDHGAPSSPNWWPIHICAPLVPPVSTPESMLGTPLISPGWAQQIEINQLAAIDYAKAKRAIRIFIGDRTAIKDGDRKAVENKVMAGQDGAFIWVTGAQGKNLSEVVSSLDFRGSAPEVGQQREKATLVWGQVNGMPPSVLQLVGTADTATQDAQGISQGQAEMRLITDEFQLAAAYVIRFWAGIIRENYSEERLRRLLGSKAAGVVMDWKHTALDGDRISVRLGPRAKSEEAVDRKQLMEAIQLIQTVLVDDIGAPRVNVMPLVEELVRSFGLGSLDAFQTDPEDPRYQQVLKVLDSFAKLLQELEQRIGQATGSGTSNQAGGGGTPGPNAQFSPTSAAPESGTLNAGARRDTVNV